MSPLVYGSYMQPRHKSLACPAQRNSPVQHYPRRNRCSCSLKETIVSKLHKLAAADLGVRQHLECDTECAEVGSIVAPFKLM